VVRDDILFWHGSRWTVHALTVMPDHVHILASPLEMAPGRWHSLSTILRSVKCGAALKINRMRGRRGALWQAESFDRIVRDEREFDEKANYILSNAVKAELVKDGWEYDGLWCPGMDVQGVGESSDVDTSRRERGQGAD
jgi:REP element-mobilizing transposase RayT